MKKFIILMILLATVSLVMFSCGDGTTEEPQNTEIATQPPADESEDVPPVTDPPAPATEPEPTTERPVINYEIVKRFTFDNPDDIGWRATNQISDFLVEGGVLKVTSIGGDPFFTAEQPLDIAADEIDVIRIRAKNMTDNEGCQFFFDTDIESGLSESKSYREYYMYIDSDPASDEWNDILIYTADCDLWEGTIKTIRFDPAITEGDVYIEYISFEKRVQE